MKPSPSTRTTIDELDVIHDMKDIPPIFWNAAGAMYAYLYVELSKIGVPNARYWILKQVKDNFGPGDVLVATNSGTAQANDPDLEIQAYQTQTGRKLLLINKRNGPRVVKLPPEADGGEMDYADLSTGENPPQTTKINGTTVTLSPFQVAVVHLKP